jgi:glycosyltransferase involved in cell wall biosynthesis
MQLIKNANAVLAVSEYVKRVFIDLFNYSNDVKIIHNGISITDLKIQNKKIDSNLVIFAGMLAEKKGVLSLIKAWEIVVAEIPSAKLLLYGKGGREILRQINKLISDKTRESIELKGYVSRAILAELYSTASCAIFPSYVETFGMAPLESMLEGCPTIFTKRSSGEELILNGENGLLIDPDNLNEIANAILFMLLNRPAAIEMGKKGAQTITERFNISRIAEDHVELYNTLLRKQTN